MVVPVRLSVYFAPNLIARSSPTPTTEVPAGVVWPASPLRLTCRWISNATIALRPPPSNDPARLQAVPPAPSLHGPELPPLQTGSPIGKPKLSSKRFCPGDQSAAKRN